MKSRYAEELEMCENDLWDLLCGTSVPTFFKALVNVLGEKSDRTSGAKQERYRMTACYTFAAARRIRALWEESNDGGTR